MCTVSTTRKRSTRQTRQTPSENIAKLVAEVRCLQTEKASLTSHLNEVQLELTNVREDYAKSSESLKEVLENGEMSNHNTQCDSQASSQKNSHENNKVRKAFLVVYCR